MTILTRLATGALLVGLLTVPAIAGESKFSPAGSWQSSDGQARVKVTLCGDGTQLCARLVGLAGEARTEENLQLLNTYVVEKAARADANVWEGTLHFNGETATGHITLTSDNAITVSACELGMCKTLEFRRVGTRPPTVADLTDQMPPRTVDLTLPE